MVYELTHFLQNKAPFVWEEVERVNSALFQIRYGWKMRRMDDILRHYPSFSIVEGVSVPVLLRFFETQPESAYRYFKPHSFDENFGTQMCLCAMDIAQALGLRMFETISKDNIASLRSTEKVLNIRIVEELENDYLYIEDLGKKSN